MTAAAWRPIVLSFQGAIVERPEAEWLVWSIAETRAWLLSVFSEPDTVVGLERLRGAGENEPARFLPSPERTIAMQTYDKGKLSKLLDTFEQALVRLETSPSERRQNGPILLDAVFHLDRDVCANEHVGPDDRRRALGLVARARSLFDGAQRQVQP